MEDLPDRNNKTLTCVRELGFDQIMAVGKSLKEKVFFLGPVLCDSRREIGAHATEEAILDFIAYYENAIEVARDYLSNGRNNKTHEWRKSKKDPK
jgi:hypothetical protein